MKRSDTLKSYVKKENNKTLIIELNNNVILTLDKTQVMQLTAMLQMLVKDMN